MESITELVEQIVLYLQCIQLLAQLLAVFLPFLVLIALLTAFANYRKYDGNRKTARRKRIAENIKNEVRIKS